MALATFGLSLLILLKHVELDFFCSGVGGFLLVNLVILKSMGLGLGLVMGVFGVVGVLVCLRFWWVGVGQQVGGFSSFLHWSFVECVCLGG